MRVEVRCCCDPGKLLGWIELAGRAHVAEGERFTFMILKFIPGEAEHYSAESAHVRARELSERKS